MKLLNFFRKEKGSVSVIVALAMVVLLGSTALAVDYGNLASEKRSFQNALDSAALAGVRELPDYTKAKRVAIDYLEYNGVADAEERVNRGEIQIFQSADGEELTVRGTNDVDYFFAAIFGGGTSGKVGGNATAKKAVGGFFADNDCALLSLSETVPMTLAYMQINLNDPIHSNYKVKLDGLSGNFSYISACYGIDKPDWFNGISSSDSYAPKKEMPTVDNLVDVALKLTDSEFAAVGINKIGDTYYMNSYDATGTHAYNRLTAKYGDEPIYFPGNVILEGDNFNTTGTILAKGDVTIRNTSFTMNSTSSICFVSEEGDINITSSSKFHGVFFAPNGKFCLSNFDAEITGAVIADQISITGGSPKITFDPEAGAHVPVGGGNAKLVA